MKGNDASALCDLCGFKGHSRANCTAKKSNYKGAKSGGGRGRGGGGRGGGGGGGGGGAGAGEGDAAPAGG
eukprot:3281786-Rhodomonas_salina.2